MRCSGRARRRCGLTGASSGIGYELAKQERVVSHSLTTKLQARASRFMPDRVKAAMHRRTAEPGSADDDT